MFFQCFNVRKSSITRVTRMWTFFGMNNWMSLEHPAITKTFKTDTTLMTSRSFNKSTLKLGNFTLIIMKKNLRIQNFKSSSFGLLFGRCLFFICLFKFPGWLYLLLQSLHAYAFSLVCTTKWRFSFQLLRKILKQNPHWLSLASLQFSTIVPWNKV